MSQVFVRSDQLGEKIYEVKLPIPQWKILFSLDGKMADAEVADFLEMEHNQVQQGINHLQELGLVTPVEGTEEPKEEQPTQPEEELMGDETQFLEDETDFKEEESFEDFQEPEEETEFEGEVEETEEEKEIEDETLEEKFTFEPEKEETEEAEDEGFEELSLDEEEEKGEQEEEDLDQLINDLLKEESEGATEEEEAPMPDEEDLESLETEETTEEETTTETEEKDDFDLGDIFQSDISETEQSIEEMLETTEPEEEVEEKEEVPEVPPKAEKGGPKKILVVDDSVVIRKMVEIALENENYEIVSVASGKEAFAFLDEKDPDLVILDIMLPDVNGLDILKTIKTSKQIPVVMLSAKDTPRETGKAKELGADDFIPKPFKDEELIGKIHELIGE